MTLCARAVSVTLGGVRVLEDVDLTCAPGELVALVGPNGAGKSTLLSVLAGDLEPAGGSVELDERPVSAFRPRDLARRRAVLLQKQSLAFGFLVRDVVQMGRAPWYGTPQADEDDRVVDASMVRADVDAFAERLYPTLSGGEQARVSFARILAQQTAVVFLDEPTAALDIRHQEALLRVARETARAGGTVVLVLHDLSLAAAYADRVCLLSKGRVRADGPPAQVLTSALLTEVYEHPVEVVEYRGALVVVPDREGAPCAPVS